VMFLSGEEWVSVSLPESEQEGCCP